MLSPQHRIFISHSHLDNEFGSKLAQDLRQALGDEQAVWYDVLGLHGGDAWWEKIVEELTARDIFLLVLSPEAMNSYWVLKETNIAINERKHILPVLYRNCTIRADLKIYQIISFLAPKPYQAAFHEVLVALGLPTSKPVERKETVQPPATDPASRILQQMETSFSQQDWPDVIRKANLLINRYPASASSSVYRMQAIALKEEGKLQQAQEAFETALALVSDRQQRLTLLSDYTALLAQQQQWDEVFQRAREALRLAPNDPAWLATQQQAQSQLVRASSVSQSLSVQPSPVPQKTKEQWIEESYKLNSLKRYDEALVAAEQAIRLDPNYAVAYNSKGFTLDDLKRYDEAISAYEQAISLDPNYAVAYNNKGSTLDNLERYDEALSAFEQAIRLDPNYADAYYNKGEIFKKLKLYYEALVAYKQAIRLNSNDAEAYYGEGEVLKDLNRYDEALVAYNQAIRINPNYAEAYYWKGEALKNLGKHKEAQQAFDKAKELGYSGE